VHRERQYLLLMGLRMVAIVVAVVVPGIWRWIAVAAGILLPYFAVILVNALKVRGTPDDPNYFVPEPKTAITDAGLTLGSVALIYSDTAPAESVIDQAPPARVEASAGSHVAISVSRGPAPASTPTATAVPNVIGQSQSEAIAALQAASFVVVVYQVSSTTVPAGTVSAQSPTGGVLAEPGTTVTIVVSTSSPAP